MLGVVVKTNRDWISYLAPNLRRLLTRIKRWDKLEEVRIRIERPLILACTDGDFFLNPQGRLITTLDAAYTVTADDCARTWELMSRSSLYCLEEEMRRGYLTLPGGHRVGIAGKVVLNGGAIKRIRDVAGLNIRIARAVTGVAKPLLPRLTSRNGGTVRMESTLIVSPPQCGKTTLLRDLARILSWGHRSLPGLKVVIIDERSEIAACYRGIPQHDLGPRTDVLDGCPKAEGAMMALRGLSPDVLVTDEIGHRDDVEALIEARNGGVCVLASAHGKNLQDVQRRPALKPLWEEQIFGRVVVLSRDRGPGTVAAIHSFS